MSFGKARYRLPGTEDCAANIPPKRQHCVATSCPAAVPKLRRRHHHQGNGTAPLSSALGGAGTVQESEHKLTLERCTRLISVM